MMLQMNEGSTVLPRSIPLMSCIEFRLLYHDSSQLPTLVLNSWSLALLASHRRTWPEVVSHQWCSTGTSTRGSTAAIRRLAFIPMRLSFQNTRRWATNPSGLTLWESVGVSKRRVMRCKAAWWVVKSVGWQRRGIGKCFGVLDCHMEWGGFPQPAAPSP